MTLLLLQTGINRLVYKSKSFQAGLTVTAFLWSPTLVKSAKQTLTEISDGLYYLDYNFNSAGVWPVILMENDIKTAFVAVRVDAVGLDIDFLKDIEGGRWNIKDNQMIFYKADNVTEVARFDLYDAAGLPAEKDIMERVRV